MMIFDNITFKDGGLDAASLSHVTRHIPPLFLQKDVYYAEHT
jgi:hypothetical protein